MSRQHHVVAASRKARPVFLLWFTNEEDGLVTDGPSRLRIFATQEEARSFAVTGSLTS